MTEEYKINILKQLTGQVDEEQGNDIPIFTTTNNGTDTLNSYIAEQGYTGSFDLDFSYTRNNQQVLFYTVNRDDPAATPLESFIVITDMDLQPLGIIKQWNSGVDFRVFHKPINNDTGTGRIYFIDVDSSNFYSPRIVYMNDPTSKKVGDEYEAEILASYFIPNTTQYDYVWNFNKDENGGNFAIATFNSSTNKISLTEFVNNVGSENEWNIYTYNTALPSFNGEITIYPIWSENFECRVCFGNIDTYPNIKVLHTQKNGDTLSLTLQSTIELPTSLQSFTNKIGNITMLNYNYLYCYSQGTFGDDTTSTFLEVNLNTSTMNILYTTPYNSTFYIQSINGQIFFIRKSYLTLEDTEEFYFGMISKGQYYEIPITQSIYFNPLFFIINSFNLYSIRIIDETGTSDTMYKFYLIYNQNNYNGAAFEGIQSVISNSIVLNNSDGLPIFARNLYNKTTMQNTVESTVEIPAYQLNGITIAEQTLVSKNNNNIVFQYNDIEKNIYENVLMNFFNTLTIIDNNERKNKVMTAASNYFVNGLENQEYENIKALKYRITYNDNSTYTGTIGEMSINNNIATLGFVIYTRAGISKLEILSNDEITIYATIDETFDPSSYYKIEQEVVIN